MAERSVLTPKQVAAMMKVDSKTVTRWAARGQLPRSAWFWTPGKHRRFWEDEIRKWIREHGGEVSP